MKLNQKEKNQAAKELVAWMRKWDAALDYGIYDDGVHITFGRDKNESFSFCSADDLDNRTNN